MVKAKLKKNHTKKHTHTLTKRAKRKKKGRAQQNQ